MYCIQYRLQQHVARDMWQVHLLKATLWMMCAEALLWPELPHVPQAPPFASVLLLPLSYAYICLGLEQLIVHSYWLYPHRALYLWLMVPRHQRKNNFQFPIRVAKCFSTNSEENPTDLYVFSWLTKRGVWPAVKHTVLHIWTSLDNSFKINTMIRWMLHWSLPCKKMYCSNWRKTG